MSRTDRSADSRPSERPLPNVSVAIGFAIAVAVLWMITLGGAGSSATLILTFILGLIGLPLSTRYSFRTLQRLNQHRSGSTFSHLVRGAVALLALLIDGWLIFMVAGYALIVVFSILSGGPIVATHCPEGISGSISRNALTACTYYRETIGAPPAPGIFRLIHTSRWSELGKGNTPTNPKSGSELRGQNTAPSRTWSPRLGRT